MNIPKSYRLLTVGEVIKPTDMAQAKLSSEMFNSDLKYWIDAEAVTSREVTLEDYCHIIRKEPNCIYCQHNNWKMVSGVLKCGNCGQAKHEC